MLFRTLDKPNFRKLIEQLLEHEEFADYWAMKWCDLLRVKSEFPIKLWPNALQAYHHWIHTSIRENMPYDRFVREMLTGSGSNFRYPQVNFYRAVQSREPQAVAQAVALREPCLLEGVTSTSKTSSILYLAALLNQPVVRLNLNGQTDTGELVGRFVPEHRIDDLPLDPEEMRDASELLEIETIAAEFGLTAKGTREPGKGD